MHSHVSGQGDTIVLLHGYLSSGHYFKHLRKQLEADYQVIALDLLGFGKSPKPRIDHTYEDHISAVQATLDHLGVKKPFILLGHSMGALIALRYATIHADDMRQLLLFNPPLFADRSEMIKTHKAAGRRYRVMLYARGRHVLWLALRLVPRRRTLRRTSINFTDMISMSRHGREGSYKHVIGGANAFMDLRKVRVPTLLVVGNYDRPEYLDNLATRTLSAEVTVAKINVDHHPLVRNVEESQTLIRNYLQNK